MSVFIYFLEEGEFESEKLSYAQLETRSRTLAAEIGQFAQPGDLGCILDGQLFVSGRIKDWIVIRGHNHYPQDIEDTVSQLHEAFRPNATAACGCPDDGTGA